MASYHFVKVGKQGEVDGGEGDVSEEGGSHSPVEPEDAAFTYQLHRDLGGRDAGSSGRGGSGRGRGSCRLTGREGPGLRTG